MVAIARYLNVTLIVPELDKASFWADPRLVSNSVLVYVVIAKCCGRCSVIGLRCVCVCFLLSLFGFKVCFLEQFLIRNILKVVSKTSALETKN